tara:strand:- start:38 stop:478 length:441 start_codon:yes stop_codon:yes gene_type:complete
MIKIKLLKNIDEENSKFIFNLRNKLYVRKNSLTIKKISKKNHKDWINKFFKNKRKNKLYIIRNDNLPAGYIRLEFNKNAFNTSWALIKKFQGKGIAKKGLIFATKNKKDKYSAIVKKDNVPSLKVALSAKFKLTKQNKNILYLKKN